MAVLARKTEMATEKRTDPGFTTINVRYPNAQVAQLDACLEKLKEQSPGVSLKRSDVIRMGVDLLARNLLVKPKKSAKAAR